MVVSKYSFEFGIVIVIIISIYIMYIVCNQNYRHVVGNYVYVKRSLSIPHAKTTMELSAHPASPASVQLSEEVWETAGTFLGQDRLHPMDRSWMIFVDKTQAGCTEHVSLFRIDRTHTHIDKACQQILFLFKVPVDESWNESQVRSTLLDSWNVGK